MKFKIIIKYTVKTILDLHLNGDFSAWKVQNQFFVRTIHTVKKMHTFLFLFSSKTSGFALGKGQVEKGHCVHKIIKFRTFQYTFIYLFLDLEQVAKRFLIFRFKSIFSFFVIFWNIILSNYKINETSSSSMRFLIYFCKLQTTELLQFLFP